MPSASLALFLIVPGKVWQWIVLPRLHSSHVFLLGSGDRVREFNEKGNEEHEMKLSTLLPTLLSLSLTCVSFLVVSRTTWQEFCLLPFSLLIGPIERVKERILSFWIQWSSDARKGGSFLRKTSSQTKHILHAVFGTFPPMEKWCRNWEIPNTRRSLILAAQACHN